MDIPRSKLSLFLIEDVFTVLTSFSDWASLNGNDLLTIYYCLEDDFVAGASLNSFKSSIN